LLPAGQYKASAGASLRVRESSKGEVITTAGVTSMPALRFVDVFKLKT
jgi:hypothetical protein